MFLRVTHIVASSYNPWLQSFIFIYLYCVVNISQFFKKSIVVLMTFGLLCFLSCTVLL